MKKTRPAKRIALTLCAIIASGVACADDGSSLSLRISDTDVRTPWGATLLKSVQTHWIDPWRESGGEAVKVVIDGADRDYAMLLAPAETIERACTAGEVVAAGAGMTGLRLFRPDDTTCGAIVTGTRLAVIWRRDAWPDNAPSEIGAVFDPTRFPGRRALVAGPDALLEWALMSFNVPRSDVYELLSTERGLSLAFRRLDAIRDTTVWCQTTRCAFDAIANGEVKMAMIDESLQPLPAADSDYAVLDTSVLFRTTELALASREPVSDAAAAFIRWAQKPERLAALARATGVDTALYAERRLDSAWYARTRAGLQRRLTAWLDGVRVRP